MIIDRPAAAGPSRSERRASPADIRSRSRKAIVASVVVVMFLAFTGTWLFIGEHPGRHLVAFLMIRRVYILPVAIAAWWFGLKGGLPASLAASAIIMLQFSYTKVYPGFVQVDYIDASICIFTGVAIGLVRDSQERRSRELLSISSRLEEANTRLEERNIRLVGLQEYTTLILRSITSAVLTVGSDGTVSTVNPAAERLLGIPDTQLVGRRVGALFSDDGGLSLDVKKVLTGRIPFMTRDVELESVGGRQLHVQTSISRMRMVTGKVVGAVVSLEDVSDLRALTDQLIRADRLASMGELTAGVAHEVRNPLGVIRASVQLLEDANCDQARIHQSAEVIKQEIDRLDRVIKALLDFGRPSSPTFGPVDVAEVLNDVAMFTETFAKKAGVGIEVEILGDVPNVRADADQLKQVFLNLVTNAVQAIGDEGGHIVLSAEREGEYASIRIADDGPGIPADDLDKVFDPFFTRRSEGTGLGLTIVHRIIDLHDGRVDVRSSDQGTVFTISLPLQTEDQKGLR